MINFFFFFFWTTQNDQLLKHLIYVYICLASLQYFSIRKHPHKQNDGREDESMEVIEMNFYEDIMFDYIPNDEDDSIAMLLGNLNEHYPYPNDLMDLTVNLDQHQQATSSSPPADHMSSNDFLWWCDGRWYRFPLRWYTRDKKKRVSYSYPYLFDKMCLFPIYYLWKTYLCLAPD